VEKGAPSGICRPPPATSIDTSFPGVGAEFPKTKCSCNPPQRGQYWRRLCVGTGVIATLIVCSARDQIELAPRTRRVRIHLISSLYIFLPPLQTAALSISQWISLPNSTLSFWFTSLQSRYRAIIWYSCVCLPLLSVCLDLIGVKCAGCKSIPQRSKCFPVRLISLVCKHLFHAADFLVFILCFLLDFMSYNLTPGFWGWIFY